jgi:putative AlgH/UPF0301 family transcriptional regulator
MKVFNSNPLFMGGEKGNDMAVMVHKYDLGGFSKYLGNGLYVGGMRQAQELIESYQAKPKEFKFFFNYVEWGPGELDKEVAAGRWDAVRVPPDMVLDQGITSSKGLWHNARNMLASTAAAASQGGDSP